MQEPVKFLLGLQPPCCFDVFVLFEIYLSRIDTVVDSNSHDYRAVR